MSAKLVNPAGLYDGTPVGMSQAKVDLESKFVFVSGQVDWDRDSRVRHATLEGQAEGAIEHLVTVLNEADSSLENVLQLRVCMSAASWRTACRNSCRYSPVTLVQFGLP
jgi:enamine deaminase RidA (YjgF/YER057c/UK114 family)